MKILIVHNAYGKTSGEEIVIDGLVKLLESRGVTVQRFSRSSTEIEETRLGRIPAFFSGIHNQFSRKAFGQFLRETRPDVVHIHNLYPLISPSILPECTAQGFPVVMTVHNFRLACPNGLLMSHGEVCHRCLGGREYWCILRNVDHYLCLTRFQRDILVKEGLPQDRVSVLTNPVEIKVAEQSVEMERDSVLFVGRVSREKGIASLFDAARVCSDIPFVVAGSWQAMSEASELAPGNVTLLGPVPSQELGALYEKARIFVLPSVWYEGFPTVLLEAMSHGLPVVCSRIGGLPEIIDDGVTGLLYEPGNVDVLADRIRTLWQNPALCQKLGEAGRRKVLEEYAADRLLDRLLGIYEKVIMEGSRKCQKT
jgi:glycosyltransferase involved in cell wall biosynthesis